MESEELAQIKSRILSKIKSAEEDIRDLEEQTKPIPPENAIGRISRMDAINNRSVNLAMLRQTKDTLVKLNNALGNVEGPDFGKCMNCGREIQYKRLWFRPESTRCVKCAVKG